MPRLRRVDCSSAGIRRVRRGRGFSYQEADGTTIADREVMERIRELAIPPAWKEVWICPHPNGHIQATGHRRRRAQAVPLPPSVAREPRPREVRRDGAVREVAAARCASAPAPTSARRGLVRERVLACAVRLLDLGFFRIGSERYTEENETFGLSTLRRKHVTVSAGVAQLSTTRRRARNDHRPGDRRPGDRADDQAAQGPRWRRLRAARLQQGRSGWVDVDAGGHQRLPEARHRRRLQRQGLPHLERDRARRGRAGDQRRRGEDEDGAKARRRPRRPSGSPTTSPTRRPSAARPTSTRASSTATTAARRSAARCGGWSRAPTRASSSSASGSSGRSCG